MPGLNGVAYQIGNWTNLRPELPGILKEFAKAAIRTDPNDIVQWQVATFQVETNLKLFLGGKSLWLFLKINPFQKKRKSKQQRRTRKGTRVGVVIPFRFPFHRRNGRGFLSKILSFFGLELLWCVTNSTCTSRPKKGVGWAALRWKQLYEQTISRYEKLLFDSTREISSKVFSWQFRFPSKPVKRKLT